MTDREMLELAAKAYWGDEIDDVVSVDWCDSDECIEFAHVDNQDHNGNDVWVLWNPLNDDGDAMRLAVMLKIDVSHDARAVFNDDRHIGLSEIFDDEGDRLERTRRAITRAAAEIGKVMQ